MTDQTREEKIRANEEFWEMFEESELKLRIGLEAQGHMPTVERMLGEGATWDEIGKAIGWHGPAAKQWYERAKEAKRI